jgi:amino acid transporter
MVVVFALSGADIYTGSRILYGLALDGQAPAIFRRVSVAGMPVLALFVTIAFTFLTYVGQHEETQGTFHILHTPQIQA